MNYPKGDQKIKGYIKRAKIIIKTFYSFMMLQPYFQPISVRGKALTASEDGLKKFKPAPCRGQGWPKKKIKAFKSFSAFRPQNAPIFDTPKEASNDTAVTK